MDDPVKKVPPQQQDRQPGRETEMHPAPDCRPIYPGTGKLDGKVALVTGGDSGIGRAVCLAFAREGAEVAFLYLDKHEDAAETTRLIREGGKSALAIAGDAEQLERTFRTNIFGYFFVTQAALPHLQPGAAIVNTTSVTAYKGSEALIDYSATKGAIVAFTRSLSQQLAEKGIRVNAVAPGPIWTPLIPSTFPPEKVGSFGKDVPLARPGQPNEVAACHLFLATEMSSYMTGQVLHPNGGTIVGG